jgi:hypothetical protein
MKAIGIAMIGIPAAVCIVQIVRTEGYRTALKLLGVIVAVNIYIWLALWLVTVGIFNK